MKRILKVVSSVVVSIAVLAATVLPGCQVSAADTSSDDYLHVSGSQILDESNNPVRLTGIAWFGFETSSECFDGIWAANLEDVLDTVANRGFNLLRIPLCVQLVNQWRNGVYPVPPCINYNVNPNLAGKNSLEILDTAIAYCKKVGIKVMFDMHRVVNTGQLDGWSNGTYTTEDFEECWKWLVNRYKNDDTVIACDLFNEPHGQPGDANAIKWDGSSDANNWRYEAERVANEILDINPKLLIVVEGIEATPKEGYSYGDNDKSHYDYNWWGGNLRMVAKYPVNLGSRQSQLVYSPHDYGPSVSPQPWFYEGFTEETLKQDCWEPNWLYIHEQNIAPILVGEWGGRMDGGSTEKWMGYLADAIEKNGLNHTFWCVNPNSGDTGGILLDDWMTVDERKYNLIKPTLWQVNGRFVGLDHQVNLGENGTHVGADMSVKNSTISPKTASFDKNASKQADIMVTMNPNGNTLDAIYNGTAKLTAGTDYTVSGNTVKILSSYLAAQSTGTVKLTFDFSAGIDPQLEITVVDSSSAAVGSLNVKSYNTNTTADSNTIGVNFRITNTGSTAIDLSAVTLRYYYTRENDKPQNFFCDYSPVGSANITGTFKSLDTALTGADTYLEVGFASAAGSLNPGESVDVQIRVAKADWSNYDQSDDYSFNPKATAYTESTTVTGYVSGVLIWGVEPD